MQHTLGMILYDNDAEVIDNDTPGKEPYLFMDLFAAMAEGDKRMKQNPNIKQINVYEVFDGVRRMTLDGGRYQRVHCLLRENTPMED
jgi:hypothetical protein